MAAPVKYFVGDASKFENEADIIGALHAYGALSDSQFCCRLFGSIHQFEVAQDWQGVDANDFDSINHIAEIQGDSGLVGEAMHMIFVIRALAWQFDQVHHQ